MRHLITGASIALMVTSGMVVLGAGSALADGSAPAPSCDSYNTMLFCDPTAGSAPFTWTQTIRIDGFTSTSTFVANFIRGGCEKNAGYTLSYSYVSGGVTYDSASTFITCNPYPPE